MVKIITIVVVVKIRNIMKSLIILMKNMSNLMKVMITMGKMVLEKEMVAKGKLTNVVLSSTFKILSLQAIQNSETLLQKVIGKCMGSLLTGLLDTHKTLASMKTLLATFMTLFAVNLSMRQ